MNYQIEKDIENQIENKDIFNRKFLKYLYNFDWEQFRYLNAQLSLNDDIEACIYYLKKGYEENIKIYPRIYNFFNSEWKESQEEINSLKKQIREDKNSILPILNSKYNWNYYLYSHPEILEIIPIYSRQDIITYFITHGIQEDIISLYLLQEPKIKNIENIKNNDSSLNIDNLFNQKILEDEVNDWNSYIENNEDLKSSGISNIYEAFQHYILYGKKEGRQLKHIQIDLELNIDN